MIIEYFNSKREWIYLVKATINKKVVLISLLIMSILLITGCQSESQRVSRPVLTKQASEKFMSQEQAKLEMDDQVIERKLIKEADIRIESSNLAEATKEIRKLLDKYNGYISSSRKWQNGGQREYRHYKLRIPQKHFQQIIVAIEELGELKSEQIRGRDVTAEYIDLQARLKNFKAQEERYLKLLNQAKEVEDILKVEKELNRVRTNIEQIEGRLKYYNNKINYSTINVNISQPQSVINDFDLGIVESLKRAIRGFIGSINAIIVLIGELLPWLIFIFVFVWVIYKLFKLRNK